MLLSVLQMVLLFILFIFLPDLYIPKVVESLRNSLEDNKLWVLMGLKIDLPKILGWIERSLYGVFLIFLSQQFIAFVGIWFVFKTVGSFNIWTPVFKPKNSGLFSPEPMNQFEISENEQIIEEHKRRRAAFMVFAVGSGLSLLSVIVLGLLAKLWFGDIFAFSFKL